MDSPDDIDQFHLNREKILLDDAGYSESDSLGDLSEEETEVLPLSDNDDGSDDGSDNEVDPYYISDEDEPNGGDEQLGTRAWGSSKKAFYSQEEIGLSSSDEAEEFEEREAIELQDKMASALSETDFISLAQLASETDVPQEMEQVQVDLSKLSEEDKLKLLVKSSPELAPMLDSLRSSLGLIAALQQTSDAQQLNQLEQLKLHTHFCYCVNSMFYLLLKSSKDSTQAHPVFSRLLSLKQIISQLESIQPTPEANKHKTKEVDDDKASIEHAQWDALEYYKAVKESKARKKKVAFDEPISEEEFEDEAGEKRPISYQISRNKGLTPRRSKEQRNPRVKHRKKFKKALQKRKGQVLPVTTEMSRYAGEHTGIRSAVSRSVKIK